MKRIAKTLLVFVLGLCAAACLLLGACGGNETGGKIVVTFDAMGGNAVEPLELDAGEAFTLPDAVWEGHAFAGWYEDREYTGEPVKSGVAEKNITFYAKWADAFTLTLDLAGGELGTTQLSLGAGANLSEAVAGLEPVKDGCLFEGWLLNGELLTGSETMPTADLGLKASYRVGYTVEKYLHELGSDEYIKAEESETAYGKAGEQISPEVAVEGFHRTQNENERVSGVLSDDPKQNVFRLYYDRNEYELILRSVFSEEETEEVSYTYLYGEEIEIPEPFARDGYALVGWALRPNGVTVYPSGFFSAGVWNGERETPEKLKIEEETRLYAVWNKAYTDMFGGEDYIFLLGESGSREIYLSRGGRLFAGEYTERNMEFRFFNSAERLVLEGKLFEDGVFAYYSESRSSYVSTLYTGSGLDENIQIHLDAYNGISYVAVGDDGRSSVSEGTYTVGADGLLNATFTEGELEGETLAISLGEYRDSESGVVRPAFRVRNEEEYGMGALVRFMIQEGQLGYYTAAYQINLDGFGNAVMNLGNSVASVAYLFVDDVLVLRDSSSTLYAVILEENGVKGYMLYEPTLEHTYTGENGETLSVEGPVATCGTVSGYFTAENSALGGIIITVWSEGESYRYMLYREAVSESGYRYTYESIPEEYSEFYYQDEESVYYAPLFVFGADNEISVYGYTQMRTYALVSRGHYTVNAETGLMLYTAEEYFEAETIDDPFDLSLVRAVCFDVGVTSTSSGYLRVSYWYSVTVGDETLTYDRKYSYEAEDGTVETLTLVGGFAIYDWGDEEGLVIAGAYVRQGNILYVDLPAAGVTLVFEIDDELRTFEWLTDIIGTVYAILPDGSTTRNESLVFDGKGGAVHTVTGADGETSETSGTYADSGEQTEFGSTVYRFTSDTETFDFILLSTSTTTYFSRRSETYSGVYRSEYGELALDGFHFMGEYVDPEGEAHTGSYYIGEDGGICLSVAEGILYFDVEGGSFTKRGGEYGAYLLIENMDLVGILLEFDGYGGLTVSSIAEELETIDANGSYERTDEGYKLVYAEGNDVHTVYGALGSFALSSGTYKAFHKYYAEIRENYVVEKDYSVLCLDGAGSAVLHPATGGAENGTYLVVTEELIYYVNNAGTAARLYRIHCATGAAEVVELSPHSYYTVGLESMIFTEYGFVDIDGETRCYYDIAPNGDVLVYRRTGENANGYGFTVENFGSFNAEMSYDGKTYYENDGFALSFERDGATSGKFPVEVAEGELHPLERLTFTPTGSSEFSVRAVVVINGQNYSNAAISRTVAEDGTVSVLLTVGTYRFEVEIEYRGSQGENVYRVISMESVVSFNSYRYMLMYYTYAYISQMLGMAMPDIPNDYGAVSIRTSYDEEGAETGTHAEGSFGASSGIRDASGEFISFTDGELGSYGESALFIEFTAADTLRYRLYFTTTTRYVLLTTAQGDVAVNGAASYLIVALTRMHELTARTGDYTVEAEQILATDYTNYTVGSVFSLRISADGEEIPYDLVLLRAGVYYYISREKDNMGKIYGTVYYTVVLEAPLGPTMPYLAARVEAIAATTYYTEDESGYVDVLETDEIMLFHLDDTDYLVSECTGEDGVFNVTSSGVRYTITVAGGHAVIEEAAAEE